jgi:hypothetical protein
MLRASDVCRRHQFPNGNCVVKAHNMCFPNGNCVVKVSFANETFRLQTRPIRNRHPCLILTVDVFVYSSFF